MDITGQSEAELQKSQQIARLAVTKSVLLAGDAVNALHLQLDSNSPSFSLCFKKWWKP